MNSNKNINKIRVKTPISQLKSNRPIVIKTKNVNVFQNQFTFNKTLEKSSINRYITLFLGVPETLISQYVIAYSAQDITEIKRIYIEIKEYKISKNPKSAKFYKRTPKNTSLLAQARLASQYLRNIIQAPSKSTIKVVKSITGIDIHQKAWKYNITVLNNEYKWEQDKSKAEKEEKQKEKQKEDKSALYDIFSRGGIFSVEDRGNYVKSEYFPKVVGYNRFGKEIYEELSYFLKKFFLTEPEIHVLKKWGYKQYKLVIQIAFKEGCEKNNQNLIQKYAEGYIGSKPTNFNDISKWYSLITDSDAYIALQAYYDWQEVSEIFDHVKSIIVMWLH